MVGWHHRLSGHEFEQTPGDSEGQGSLACCSPWGHKESHTTEPLNDKDSVILQSCDRRCRTVEKNGPAGGAVSSSYVGKDFYRRFALCKHFSHVSQDFISQSSFWFMAKSTGRHRDFPNTPCIKMHAQPSPLSLPPSERHICYQEGTFDDRSLSPKVRCLPQGSLGAENSMGLDTCMMTFIHHYSITSLP